MQTGGAQIGSDYDLGSVPVVGGLFTVAQQTPNILTDLQAATGDVWMELEINAERWDAGIADIGHADDRARLWIELAKSVKRGRELLGKDREIALHETVGDARGARSHAGAAGMAGRDAEG